MELLQTATSRPVIVTFAVVGALLVSIASLMRRPDATGGVGPSTGMARTLTRLGYAVSFLSVVLFIIAGFRIG